MKVKEFSNYRAPRRRPWVPIVILVVVVLAVIWFVRRPGKGEAVPAVDPGIVAEQPTAAAPVRPETSTRRAQPTIDPVATVLPGNVAAIVAQAGQQRQANQLQAARELYQQALALAVDPDTRAQVEQLLGDVHIELIFSPRPMPEKEEYVISRGDQLRLLARRYRTTVELIQRGNNITDPNRIRIGDRLRIFTGEFEIVASKSRRDMVVYLHGAFFKRYRVGTGVFGKTPVGTFVINDKLVEPSWWPSDGREVPFGHPENILGTRWMSIEATGETPRLQGYGIHGTWSPESIGHEESAGCIRMINDQVEELYIYIPIGTAVRIEE